MVTSPRATHPAAFQGKCELAFGTLPADALEVAKFTVGHLHFPLLMNGPARHHGDLDGC